LRTSEVKQVIEACLEVFSQLIAALEKLSLKNARGRRERYLIAFKAIRKDKKIASQFDELERHKSSLSLCIHNIDA
jgi:hypothetical protein